MLVAMAVALKASAAITSLKQSIEAGTFGAALTVIGNGNVQSMALALTGVLLAAPDNMPTAIARKGNTSDQLLVALLNDSAVDQDVVDKCANIIFRLSAGSTLLSSLSNRLPLHQIGRRVFSSLVRSGYKFGTTRGTLVSARPFLQSISDSDVLDTYFENLSSGADVLSDLAKRPVTDASAFTAHRIYRTRYGQRSVALRNKLSKYSANASIERWQDDISQNGLLLSIAEDMHRLSRKRSIGVSGLDALINLLLGSTTTAIAAQRYATVADLLDPDLSENLAARLWSTVLNIGDAQQRRAAVAMADKLLFDIRGTDFRAIANVVLVPLIVDPDATAIEWMIGLFASNRGALEAEPGVNVELRARINIALRQSSGVDQQVKRSLRRLARELPKKSSSRERSSSQVTRKA